MMRYSTGQKHTQRDIMRHKCTCSKWAESISIVFECTGCGCTEKDSAEHKSPGYEHIENDSAEHKHTGRTSAEREREHACACV